MKLLFALATFAAFSMSTIAADDPVYHVVHFKFKADSKKEDIAKVVTAFAALKTKIPAIQDFKHGTNSSPEGLSKGFTHCWIATPISSIPTTRRSSKCSSRIWKSRWSSISSRRNKSLRAGGMPGKPVALNILNASGVETSGRHIQQ